MEGRPDGGGDLEGLGASGDAGEGDSGGGDVAERLLMELVRKAPRWEFLKALPCMEQECENGS